MADHSTQFTAYYQAGAKAIIGSLKANGEDPIPVFADILKVYDTRELSATEILQVCALTLSRNF